MYDHWMTPPDFMNLVREYYDGSIDTDPASNKVSQEYVQAKSWYGLDHEDSNGRDGLQVHWRGNVWLNPPYSAGNVDTFVDKAVSEWYGYDGICRMLILVNSSTDTRWYHKLLNTSSAILMVKGRIKFWKVENGEAHRVWEGEKSKQNRLEGITDTAKIGNSPRYVSTLFCYTKYHDLHKFTKIFSPHGTVLKKV